MALSAQIELASGSIVSGYRIIRGEGQLEEPYLAEFRVGGRSCSCPLYVFLPSTQAADQAPEIRAVAG